jgi:hypothetical protein
VGVEGAGRAVDADRGLVETQPRPPSASPVQERRRPSGSGTGESPDGTGSRWSGSGGSSWYTSFTDRPVNPSARACLAKLASLAREQRQAVARQCKLPAQSTGAGCRPEIQYELSA